MRVGTKRAQSAKLGGIRAWVCWGVCGIFVLYQFLLQSSTSVMVHGLEHDFHIRAAGVGLLSSSFFYTYLLAQIPAGLIVDRFNLKTVMVVSIFLCALSTLIFSTTQNLVVAELARMLMGLVTAPAVVASLYVASFAFEAKYFALLAGLTEMLGMFGGFICQAILPHYLRFLNWHHLLYGTVVFGLVLAVVALMGVRDSWSDITSSESKPSIKSITQSLWSAMHSKQVWYCGLVLGMIFASIAAFAGLWAVQSIQNLYQVGFNKAALLSSMIFLGAMLGAPVFGGLSGYLSRKGLMWFGVLVDFCLILLLVYWPYWSVPMLLGLLFFLGFAAGVYIIPFALIRDRTSVKCRGMTMGFANMMCILIGSLLFQPLIGWLLDYGERTGISPISRYQLALWVLPLALIIAMALLLFIKDSRIKVDSA